MRHAYSLVVLAACGGAATSSALDNRGAEEPSTATAPPEESVFAPVAFEGPFKSVDDYCAHSGARCLPTGTLVDRGATITGDNGATVTSVQLVGVEREPDPMNGASCAIVFRTVEGVWVHPDALPCRGAGGTLWHSIVVDDLRWNDFVDSAVGPELLLVLSTARQSGGGWEEHQTTWTICGTGASGHPGCTPPIIVADQGMGEYVTNPKIDRHGTLTFRLETKNADDVTAGTLTLTSSPHRIVFR